MHSLRFDGTFATWRQAARRASAASGSATSTASTKLSSRGAKVAVR